MAVGDQYTKSLLHFDGGITDESGKTWTANGGATTNTAQKKFGSGALYLDGVDDYLTTVNNSDFQVSNGSFTFDWWEYRPVAAKAGAVFEIAPDNGIGLVIGYGYTCYLSSNGTNFDIAGGATYDPSPTLNAWNHFAIVRNGTSFKAYKNGTEQAGFAFTSSASLFFDANTIATIGLHRSNSLVKEIYIDEPRFSKGIARWTSNFTPPTAPYGATIRLCQAIGGF